MNKRPKTTEEFFSLPVSGFGYFEHIITDDDICRGFAMVLGRRINVDKSPRSRRIVVPTRPSLLAVSLDDSTVFAAIDEEGRSWALAKREDGEFVRVIA